MMNSVNNGKLHFAWGNAKLSNSIVTFSLPAGHSCPFAKECLSKADRYTGKITDGKYCRYRCFSATEESPFSNVRQLRWENLDNLHKIDKSIEKMADLIQLSLPFGATIVRFHASGDFFSEKYFLAWVNVAQNNRRIIFYGYSKAIPFWLKYKKYLPSNFRLTASLGGKFDMLVKKHRLKYADVVFSPDEAERKSLDLDHDDSHAINGKQSFCLLLHGTQPQNSEAAKALKQLRKQKIGKYNEKTKSLRKNKSIKMYITLKQGEIYLPQSVKYTPRVRKGFPQRIKL